MEVRTIEYINMRKIYSYNRLYNYIVGLRGRGKTFGVKQRCVNQFITRNNKFLWIRRYREEVKETKDSLFMDINKKYLNTLGTYITNTGNNYYYNIPISSKKIEKIHMGKIIYINQSQSLKSSFLEEVNTICYDEFIIEDNNHHYFTNEVSNLVSIINSTDRDRNFVRCFLLGNTVTQYNPYFENWNIQGLNKKQIYYTDFNPEVLVVYDSKSQASQKQTKLAKAIEGTKLARYVYEGDFIQDENDIFVSERPYYAKYQFTLIYNNVYYGVWYSYSEMKWWISEKYDKNYKTIIAATGKDLKPNSMILKTSMHIKYLKYAYSKGIVFYENQKVYKKCSDLMKILNLY